MTFRLYAKCMPKDITLNEMEDMFGKFGQLKEIWLSGTNPRFGFVVYRDIKTATKALNEMNGRWLGGKYIRVSHALPRSNRFQMKNTRRKKLICYRCGQPGHYQYNCEIRNSSAIFGMDSQSSSSTRKKESGGNTYDYKRFRRHDSHSKKIKCRDKTKRRSSTERRQNSRRNAHGVTYRQHGRSRSRNPSDQRG